MKQRELQLQDAYTRIAPSYDKTRFVSLVEEFTTTALLNLIDVREGVNVLDVAAGTGRTAIPLAKTGATVVALDLTPAMLVHLRSKGDRLGLKNLYIQRANAREMPFRNDSFDVVVSSRFLHLYDFQEQILLLREMHRVLKPGGTLLVEYSNQSAFWAGGFLRDILLYIQRRKPRGRVDQHQIQMLYQDYQIIRQQGISWPLIGTIARVSPRIAKLLLKLSMQERLGKFTRSIWVVSTKKAELPHNGMSQI
jgi:ubiquinone/menaquinone biosynthesis C-methylase UbiE